MTKRRIIILSVVIIAWILWSRLPPLAKVTLRVVDEKGAPVKDAHVELCFKHGCLTKEAIKGVTDQYGLFSHIGWCWDGHVGGGVGANAHYGSAFGYRFYPRKQIFLSPWNKEIIILLRPIVNPVPMYVRNRWFKIPVVGKNVGFDLSSFDWVKPYGEGRYQDFIFRVDRKDKSLNDIDATLTLTFPNKFDGIQVIKDNRGDDGSVLRLLRQAPLEGYQQKIVKRLSRGEFGFRNDDAEDNNFIFRVRSTVNDKNEVKAMYGKILGDLDFDPINSNTSGIRMHYYLNPDYTRNLEFDPKRNLFSNLPEGEGVGLP